MREYDDSLITELTRLQREHNERLKNATRQERAKAAIEHLRYIASVEPDSYGYLFEDDDGAS